MVRRQSFFIVGALLIILGFSMFFSVAWSLFYGDGDLIPLIQSITLTLTANDPDDDPLTFIATSDNENILVSINENNLSVNPLEHYFGVAIISIIVTDGLFEDTKILCFDFHWCRNTPIRFDNLDGDFLIC